MVGHKKIYSFRYKLSILLFLVVLLTSSFLGICQYLFMRNIQENNFEKSRDLIRDRVINIVSDADHMNLLTEKQLEKEARLVLAEVLEKYEKEGNIHFGLLPFIAEKSNLNLYIINNSNTVVATTDSIDLGLNFSPWPDFVAYLEEIRSGKQFSTSRVSLSLNEGLMTKYCYLPSKDGKYIFETGALFERDDSMMKGIGFDNFEAQVVEDNAFVDNVTLFDYEGIAYKKNVAGDLNKISSDHMQFFEKAITSMETVEVIGQYKGRKAFYQYVPYQIMGARGANERNVIEIIYNDIDLQKSLKINLIFTVAVVILGSLISGSFGLYNARNITRPIEEIAVSIDKVSEGNFDIQLNIQSKDEFFKLSRQFENMAREIKKLLAERYENEQELEERNKQIYMQKEEITALYEETTAMNEDLTTLLQKNKSSYFETVSVLANAIEAKDSYTGGHCERVMTYSLIIAKDLKLSDYELEDLRFGSILHDIGKIGIPEAVLNQQGKFSEKEYLTMKKHPEIGDKILKELQFIDRSRRIVYEHHERMDGKGYPNGLKGDEIDLLARIVCVADAYDAMTSARPYRNEPMSKDEAITELYANKGTQFDPEIVDIFVQYLKTEQL